MAHNTVWCVIFYLKIENMVESIKHIQIMIKVLEFSLCTE